MVDSRNWDVEGSRLAGEAAADGEPTRWFEELWSAAAAPASRLPSTSQLRESTIATR